MYLIVVMLVIKIKPSFSRHDLFKENNTLKLLLYTISKCFEIPEEGVTFSKIRGDLKEAVILELMLKEFGG